MQRRARQLIERLRRGLAGGAPVLLSEILLVTAIAAVTALLTWRLLPGLARPIDTGIPAAATSPDTGVSGASVDVAALHLFGRSAGGASTTREALPTDAPETRLNLRLLGVFATGDGNGLAIIRAGNSDESVFTVGDRVAGQARIEGIFGDRVILERDGTLETLRLSVEEVDTTGATAQAGRGAASGNRDVQRIAAKARELRSRLMRNPLELARMVRFQPYLRDGELIGYRIQPRAADAALLSELGLRPTDVITTVNGLDLSDPARAQQALRQMQSARTITVTWLRDGEQHRMTIPIGSSS